MGDVLPSEELIDEPSDYGSMQPGTRLGRYELLVPIARGGMARVWAARLHGQRGFQKPVAIKTILPHLADEPEFERMFLDEARIAAGVHHPNVCEIYELGEEKRTLYLVMEWVNGDSLARVLRTGGKTTEAIDCRVAARIIADACAGLHAAHELTDEDGRSLGVVHRDLSPHNILLTSDGTAKVADFGVAKALGQLHEATSAGQLKGKIAYMAPEQVTGSAIDRRSDIFSLGCVLYEATTGQRPFRGDGDHQVMHAVLKGEVAPPTSLLRGYPQELERIVMRALSPQPILRYPTAERMRFALEELLARGQLVTQSNVAQVVRARIGEQIERRKERIRQASMTGDRVGARDGGWSEPPGAMTPSNQAHGGHRSGVKVAGAHGAGPLITTMPVGGGPPPLGMAPLSAPMMQGQDGPFGVSPVAIAPGHPYAPGHTPISYPGAGAAAQVNAGQAQAGHSYPGQAQAGHSYPGQAQAGHSYPGHAQAGHSYPQPGQMRPFTIPPTSTVPPGSMPMGSMPMGASMPVQPMHGQMGAGPGLDPHGYPQIASPPERPSAPPAGTGSYVVAIGVGVLLAVLIAVGGFFAWRSRHHAPASGSAPIAAGTVSAVSPGASAPQAGGAAGAKPTPVSVEIAFRTVPPDATLSVDGTTLTPDVRAVPRPAMGKTVTVVARAKDHEDLTVLVDFFTSSPMVLTMKPVTPTVPPVAVDPVAPALAASAAPEGPASKEPANKEPAKPKADATGEKPHPRRPAGEAAPLPPNPF